VFSFFFLPLLLPLSICFDDDDDVVGVGVGVGVVLFVCDFDPKREVKQNNGGRMEQDAIQCGLL